MAGVVQSFSCSCGSFSSLVYSPDKPGSARSRSRISSCVLNVRAEQKRKDGARSGAPQKPMEDDTWRRASLTDLEKEFGIKTKVEKKTKSREPASDSRPPRTLSPEEWREVNSKWDELEKEALGADPKKDSDFIKTIKEIGLWLIEKTKETDDVDPGTAAKALLVVFAVWFFFLLVAVGVIQLPFELPFLTET